jgi:antitoxin component YwqK of YwqJK toxin-antitoxin module
LKTGTWRHYYDTGELAIEETYIAGVKEGPFRSFYKDGGQVIGEGWFRGNKREGLFTVYSPTGCITKKMMFVNDVLIGEEILREPTDILHTHEKHNPYVL